MVTRPNCAWRARTTQGVVPCAGGLRAWPIDRCSNKDTGKSCKLCGNYLLFRAAYLEQSGTVTSTDIEQALLLAAAQQSVSTTIEGSNLSRPPNVHVGVCHWVWRPMCLAPRCVPNKPVEFPSTRSYLVDFTGVAQWSSALKTKA